MFYITYPFFFEENRRDNFVLLFNFTKTLYKYSKFCFSEIPKFVVFSKKAIFSLLLVSLEHSFFELEPSKIFGFSSRYLRRTENAYFRQKNKNENHFNLIINYIFIIVDDLEVIVSTVCSSEKHKQCK